MHPYILFFTFLSLLNVRQDVDTFSDRTWLHLDESGNSVPVEGRYIRLEIISEDGMNWVTIGEIEVYTHPVVVTSLNGTIWGMVKTSFR